jgi:hypothetical protein
MQSIARSTVSRDASGAPIVYRPQRERNGVIRNIPRKHVVPDRERARGSALLWVRVAEWAFPWHFRLYPGRICGLMAIIGNRVSRQAQQKWRITDRPPVWAAQAMAEYLEERGRIGLELAAELRAYVRLREQEPSRVGWALTKAGRAQRAAAKLPE